MTEVPSSADDAVDELVEVREQRDKLRECASAVIDGLCLKGHPLEKEWEDLLVLCGRYCEPYRSARTKFDRYEKKG
jgi:hypothetical protein